MAFPRVRSFRQTLTICRRHGQLKEERWLVELALKTPAHVLDAWPLEALLAEYRRVLVPKAERRVHHLPIDEVLHIGIAVGGGLVDEALPSWLVRLSDQGWEAIEAFVAEAVASRFFGQQRSNILKYLGLRGTRPLTLEELARTSPPGLSFASRRARLRVFLDRASFVLKPRLQVHLSEVRDILGAQFPPRRVR